MKKSILIFCAGLIIFSLTAFGFKSWNHGAENNRGEISCNKVVVSNNNFENGISEEMEFDLFCDIDTRFNAKITKENLHKAKSIVDIMPERENEIRESFKNVQVSIEYEDRRTMEQGDKAVLNTAQFKLMQSANYSDNICIASVCKNRHAVTGKKKENCLVYYMTVIPEKRAEFVDGHKALLDYLKKNSRKHTRNVKEDQLKPGRVTFTVTKKGTISNAKLTSTSGYTSLDEEMVKLISSMPGKWSPAANSKGQKVEEELVFFFANKGC